MKIRTKDDLLRVLDDDRIWRIREVSELKAVAFTRAVGQANRNAVRRAFFPMAYAHWEGYVKKAGQSYVDYVATSRPRLSDLSLNFQSIYFSVENSSDLKRSSRGSLVPILQKLANNGNDRVYIRSKDVVSTQSNLSSDVLKEICQLIGIDFSAYKDFVSFFDKVLLAKRNGIAHGEFVPFQDSDIEEISKKTIACIDIFKWQIEEEIDREGYLATPKRLAVPPIIPVFKLPA